MNQLRRKLISRTQKIMPIAHRPLSTEPKGDLFKYQNSLPNLPVPELNETAERYLRSLLPLCPGGKANSQYRKTEKLVSDFIKPNGEGEKLQKRLIELSSQPGKRNWLSTWWDDYAYLEYKDPVSPFSSYFFSHKDINTPVTTNQLYKAASLMRNTVLFMESIENETLAPETIKGMPFCMGPFKWMFNNCRVPGEEKDTTVTYPPESHRFAIVMCHGRIYKMYHHDIHGKALSEAQLYQQLLQIQSDAEKKVAPDSPVGILTSGERTTWAKSYKELTKSPINQASLEAIQASSFVLCLDDNVPITVAERSRNAWHGDGCNRWFDKPVEFFVAKNGSSGFLGEHSKMDGGPTLRMNDWVYKQVSQAPIELFSNPENSDLSQVEQWEELNFDIAPATKAAVVTQSKVFLETIYSLDLNVWQYYGLGKNQIKQLKCSPDAFIQMLMQLAYYKMTGISRPTYESASTRKFCGGRTETCRSVSLESLDFVSTWQDPFSSNRAKVAAFRDAAAAHVKYISAASDGRGCDRHLFGLKQLYTPDEKVHGVFSDPLYSYSSHWFLSTSQLSSEEFNGYGWSPVVPDGLGLAYMLNNDWMHINITCFKDNGLGLKVDSMAYYLTETANELKNLLSESVNEAKL